MATMNDRILDAALDIVRTETNALHVCSQVPTTYTQAITTYSRGSKATPTLGDVGDASPDGRKITISAITDGVVSSSGTVTHFALVDTASSRLLVTEALGASKEIATGSPFTLTEFDVRFPDPA